MLPNWALSDSNTGLVEYLFGLNAEFCMASTEQWKHIKDSSVITIQLHLCTVIKENGKLFVLSVTDFLDLYK